MTQVLEVPQAVLNWRTLADKYSAYHCQCGHIAPSHSPVTSYCFAKSCPCQKLSPVLQSNEILSEVWSESTGIPSAINPSDPSYGLLQVMIPTAEHFIGMPVTKEQLLEPDFNVKCGTYFLAHLKRLYAKTYPNVAPDGVTVNPIGWIAGYNEGEPNLWKKRPDLGYVSKFVKYLAAINSLHV